MFALPGFDGARLMRVDEPATAGHAMYTYYELVDRDALDHYLQLLGPRKRAEGRQRFGGKFSASRRILSPLDY